MDDQLSHRGGSAAGPVLPLLVEALIRRVPRYVDELADLAAAREVAYVGDLPAPEAQRSLREHVMGFLRCLAGRQPPDAQALAVPMAWGRRRAEEGVPLESVLRVHRLATQLLWEKLFDEAQAHAPGTLHRLLDESGRVWEGLDAYSQALADGYRQGEADGRRSRDRRDALIDALVEGRGVEPAIAAEAQLTFGLPAQGRFVAVAVDTAAPGERERPQLTPALPDDAVTVAWRTRGDREIGIVELGRTPLRRLVDWLSAGRARRVGVSSEVDALADLAVAHHFAVTALQTLPAGTAGVAAFDDRLLEALPVTSPHVARRLARHTFGRLLDCEPDERDSLLATLDAWFGGGCSAARAAERLHCHRNTVLNRLRRVESLTGRPLDDDRHHLACRMALLALRTLPEEPERHPTLCAAHN